MPSRDARVTNPTTGKVKTTSTDAKKPVRSFVCVSVNGRKFNSKANKEKPSSAAASMFSQWFRKKSKQGAATARVLLRESTRNGLQKEYAYEVGRKKLSKPVVTSIATFKYEHVCKSIDVEEAKKKGSGKKKTNKRQRKK